MKAPKIEHENIPDQEAQFRCNVARPLILRSVGRSLFLKEF